MMQAKPQLESQQSKCEPDSLPPIPVKKNKAKHTSDRTTHNVKLLDASGALSGFTEHALLDTEKRSTEVACTDSGRADNNAPDVYLEDQYSTSPHPAVRLLLIHAYMYEYIMFTGCRNSSLLGRFSG
jgi:hypothetical protein